MLQTISHLTANRCKRYGDLIVNTKNVVTKKNAKLRHTALDFQSLPGLGAADPTSQRALSIADSTILVQWLNASRGTTSHDRVVSIRRALVISRTLCESVEKKFQRDPSMRRKWSNRLGKAVASAKRAPDELERALAEFREDQVKWLQTYPEEFGVLDRMGDTLEAINVALSQYVFHPVVAYSYFTFDWIFGLLPRNNQRGFCVKIGSRTVSEADAALAMARLASTRDIAKVRLCVMCGKRWLFAVRSIDKFCDADCRSTYYVKSPHYHSRKAANQRRYREQLKRNGSA